MWGWVASVGTTPICKSVCEQGDAGEPTVVFIGDEVAGDHDAEARDGAEEGYAGGCTNICVNVIL